MNWFKNLGYFIHESVLLWKVDLKSNRLSVLSIMFILLIAGLCFTAEVIGENVLDVLREEADIAVFYSEETEETQIDVLQRDLNALPGVLLTERVSKESSLHEMEEILGKDKEVLTLFDENPFAPYIRVKVDLAQRNAILQEIEGWDLIEHIRDNKDVVEKLEQIIRILTVIGVFVLATVIFVSVVVISHILRQGIFLNREHIKILHLLGAPKNFIRMPFLMEGFFMSLLSGILASLLLSGLIFLVYMRWSGFGFFPLPEMKFLILSGTLRTLLLSLALGVFGSVSGVQAIRGE